MTPSTAASAVPSLHSPLPNVAGDRRASACVSLQENDAGKTTVTLQSHADFERPGTNKKKETSLTPAASTALSIPLSDLSVLPEPELRVNLESSLSTCDAKQPKISPDHSLQNDDGKDSPLSTSGSISATVHNASTPSIPRSRRSLRGPGKKRGPQAQPVIAQQTPPPPAAPPEKRQGNVTSLKCSCGPGALHEDSAQDFCRMKTNKRQMPCNIFRLNSMEMLLTENKEKLLGFPELSGTDQSLSERSALPLATFTGPFSLEPDLALGSQEQLGYNGNVSRNRFTSSAEPFALARCSDARRPYRARTRNLVCQEDRPNSAKGRQVTACTCLSTKRLPATPQIFHWNRSCRGPRAATALSRCSSSCCCLPPSPRPNFPLSHPGYALLLNLNALREKPSQGMRLGQLGGADFNLELLMWP